MAKIQFRCEALAATPDRRALLAAVGLGGPLLALMAARGPFHTRPRPDGALRVGELIRPDGALTPMGSSLAGQRIALEGYYAPALRPGAAFDLFERTTAPCLSCGLIHDPGASVAIVGRDAPPGSPLAPVTISGRLEFDARGRPRVVMS